MAADLHRLADRLNKPMPKVVVDANDVRLPASRFSPFWQATVHVLRNIMDHGIETAEERAAAGKPEAGTVTLRSVATGDQFRIEFSDDGRGIDWGKIASKALEAGLPAERHADLERALFAPGISTAAAVTDLSGRGVGLSRAGENFLAILRSNLGAPKGWIRNRQPHRGVQRHQARVFSSVHRCHIASSAGSRTGRCAVTGGLWQRLAQTELLIDAEARAARRAL